MYKHKCGGSFFTQAPVFWAWVYVQEREPLFCNAPNVITGL